MISILKSKIHRCTCTGADLHYMGSITIDEQLMEDAGIYENEEVHVLDITNGSRLATYAIKGERGKGDIIMNGAAAHLVKKGDMLIILSFAILDEEKALSHEPKIILVDEKNKKVGK